MKRSLFLFILGSAAFGACAQTEAEATKDTIELTPVEVRALRANATAPFAKTNLGKTAIEKQNNGQDLPFLLNQTPSVVINSDAGNGVGYTGIRIRGSDATRVNVTINGMPFNDAESGGTFFVDLPDLASSVNSLQIQRGVGTSSNGPGAFGATINLSTNEVNKKPYLEFSNNYGSFNTWKNTLRAGTGLLNNHFTVDMRLSNISSDGFIDRAKSSLQSYYISGAYLGKNNSIRFNHFSGAEKTYQAWNGVPQYKLFYNRDSLLMHYYNNLGTAYFTQQDSANLFTANARRYNAFLYENQTDNYKQDHYQLFYNQRLRQGLELSTGLFYVKGKGYYEEYRHDEKYSKYGLPNATIGSQSAASSDFVRQLWLDNDFYGGIFSLQQSSPKTTLTAGGAFTWYDGKHYGDLTWAEKGLPTPNYQWYNVGADKNDFNVYGKWQQNINNQWQLFADLQYRFVLYKTDGFRDNPTLKIDQQYNFFNPKLGVSYHYQNWLAFASYSIGNKEPNRDDFETGAAQQPKPEQLKDVEAQVQYQSKKFSAGATIYYMNYKNQLVLTGQINDVGAYTRTNIPKSYRAGIELEGSAVVQPWISLAANLSLSRNKIKGFQEFIDDYDNGGQKMNAYAKTDLSFSPSVVGGATVELFPAKNLEVDLLSKYVSKQYLDNTMDEHKKLNPYFTEDVRAIYSFEKLGLKKLSLLAQVNNVFNKRYEPNGYTFSYYYNNQLITENYYFPMAGTNWTVGLTIKL